MNIISCILSFFLLCILNSCANPNSHWMNDSYSKIKDNSIFNVTIPGSYISNAYNITKNSSICLGEVSLQSLSENSLIYQKLISSNDESKLEYFYNKLNVQDSDILSQLNSGIRYFDIRICKQINKYYTSNFYLTDNLDSIIQNIVNFLQSNDKEIVLIDFDNNLRSEIGYMDENEINAFYIYLKNSLNNLIVTKSMMNYKIEDLIKSNKRVILISSNPTLKSYDEVWDRDIIVNYPSPPNIMIKELTLIKNSLNLSYKINEPIFNIIPVYSEISISTLTDTIDEYQKSLITDTLKQNIKTMPAIIVTDKNLSSRLINIITSVSKIKNSNLLSKFIDPINDLIEPENNVIE